MTDFIPSASALAAQPNHPILLVCGPAAAVAARAMLPAYLVGSWATADYFNAEHGAPITNGALRSLSGRRVDLWASTRKDRWPHIRVVTELLRLGCSVRLIEPAPDELIEPFSAQASGMTATQLVAYARSRIRVMTAQDTTDTSLEFDDPAPTDTRYQHPDDDTRWEPPLDLWTSRPISPLRISCLPSAFREYVAEASDLIGCDSTVVGISALVVAASLIDDGFRVQPKEFDTTWTESARLWGAIVGDPSSKKTPGIQKAQAPLRLLDGRLAKAHTDIQRDYIAALDAHKSERGKDKPPPPERPASPRVIVDNTTVEALSDILVDNPQGILVAPDELSGWFGSMDAYNKGNSKDRADWLKLYNGGAQRIDRVTRGNIYVPNWSSCILGGIQPDMFQAVAKRIDNDGLLQRFMIVMAGRGQKDIDRTPRQDLIDSYEKKLFQLRDMRPAEGREVFRLNSEAQAIRRTFMDTIDHAAAAELPRGMLAYLGKWSGLFARLLCAYHMIEHAGRTPPVLIEAETAMQVCELMESCLYPHAYQFYGEMLGRGDTDEHVTWIAGHILATSTAEITTREISQRYKYFNRLPDALQRSIWLRLEQYQWVRPHPTARINKRSNLPTRWDVNPEVHAIFKSRAAVEAAQRAANRQKVELAVSERREETLRQQ